MSSAPAIPASVLVRWGALFGRPTAPLGQGLINETFVVEGREQRFVLQRLNPLWTPAVCEDVRAVTDQAVALLAQPIAPSTPRPASR